MAASPTHLTPAGQQFLAARHLAAFTTLRADGSPHVVPVGFTWDAEHAVARVIASRTSQKVRHAALGRPAALCQLDGRRWLTLEGTPRVCDSPEKIAAAELRYAARYRQPRVNPRRVVVEIAVHRMLGSAEFFDTGH